jgi:hypothetical protein
MNNFLDREQNLLALHSEFLEDSYLHVRVRNHGNGRRTPKILVDVTEFGHRTSMARALLVARQQARIVGVRSMDCSILRDNEIERKVMRAYTGILGPIRIRQTCFAFEAA